MYRVLAAASVAASFGLATTVSLPANAGGSHVAPKIHPTAHIQPVIGNPGIGTLRRPHSVGHVRHHGGHHRHVGFRSDFFPFWPTTTAEGGTVINNISVGQSGGSGVQAIAGIREAPTARPAIYVLESDGTRHRADRRGGARVLERGASGWTELDEGGAQGGFGPRIVSVPVR